mmetsp:Transcript_41039/g.101239  ORF Transcript_41039/g.101239 Transcript_41039/m.101239 type:complete len:220 (-) Transcript_41039:77-736(-)
MFPPPLSGVAAALTLPVPVVSSLSRLLFAALTRAGLYQSQPHAPALAPRPPALVALASDDHLAVSRGVLSGGVLIRLHGPRQLQPHVPAVGPLLHLVHALPDAGGLDAVGHELAGVVEARGAVQLLAGLQGHLVQVPRAGQARAPVHFLDVSDGEVAPRVVAHAVNAVHDAEVVDEGDVALAQHQVDARSVALERGELGHAHERPLPAGRGGVRYCKRL